MPAFTYNYLVDENGDFVLDENGDKIIIEVTRIGTTEATRRAARKPKAGFVRSFDVKRNTDDDTWHLIINKTEYVGRYQTRDEAVSVLWGMATACSGRDDMFDAAFDEQLSRGVSSIDVDPGP